MLDCECVSSNGLSLTLPRCIDGEKKRCPVLQRQRRMTCNLVVNENVINASSAHIVAVLRTHQGAAVVGGMKSSNLQQRSGVLAFTSDLKVIPRQSRSGGS